MSLALLSGGGTCRAPQEALLPPHRASAGIVALTSADDAFLDDLERCSFRFFWEQTDPHNGLVADRAGADGSRGTIASIAAVGFGLTGVCIADHRGWVTHEPAHRRVLATLRFLRYGLPHEHGFYYHFVERTSGRRVWHCELSSVDTALLMAGVLTAREYFRSSAHDPSAGEIDHLATEIFERVDWPWMLAGGKTLSMGWTPENGFLPYRWDRFSEHLILTLLAMGSRTHPLPAECWSAWHRGPRVTYAGQSFLQCPPLFAHQFPHAWIDFRGRRDGWGNYWDNSVAATLAHRQFCLDLAAHLPRKFAGHGPHLWGITASDSPHGYLAWGGPPVNGPIDPQLDGTVVPCAAAGSLPFTPRPCLDALQFMRAEYGDAIWKHYGFVDAFNPRTGWANPDVIGIDVGITLLMAENLRSGFIWDVFMRSDEIRRGMDAAGFRAVNADVNGGDGVTGNAFERDLGEAA